MANDRPYGGKGAGKGLEDLRVIELPPAFLIRRYAPPSPRGETVLDDSAVNADMTTEPSTWHLLLLLKQCINYLFWFFLIPHFRRISSPCHFFLN